MTKFSDEALFSETQTMYILKQLRWSTSLIILNLIVRLPSPHFRSHRVRAASCIVSPGARMPQQGLQRQQRVPPSADWHWGVCAGLDSCRGSKSKHHHPLFVLRVADTTVHPKAQSLSVQVLQPDEQLWLYPPGAAAVYRCDTTPSACGSGWQSPVAHAQRKGHP